MDDGEHEGGLELTRMHEFVGLSPDPMLVVDRECSILALNEAAGTQFGYATDELVGQRIEVLIPDRFRSRHPDHVRRFLGVEQQRGMGDASNLFGRRKDGSEFPVEVSLKTVGHEAGRVAIASVRDISARKRAEEQFRAIVEAAPDAMLVVDEHRTIRLANRQSRTLFYYDPTELIGQSLDLIIPARFRARHDEHLRGFFSNPTTRAMGIGGREFLARRKDDSEFPVEISLSPMRTKGGTFITALVRDVTTRKQAEQRLVAARREADAANRAKSEFLSSMSHELRTPLNGVLGYAQILMRDPVLSDTHRESLRSIRTCGEHLLELINDVLDLSQIESGGLQLDEKPCDLHRVVQDAMRIIRPRAEAKRLRTTLESSPLLPAAIVADAMRLRQVLVNLLGNAAKFTTRGEIGLRIEIDAEALRFVVHDTGPGVALEDHERIFEPLGQTEAGRAAGGAGIGLALCRRLAKAMGGRLTLDSELGAGSSFTFEVPWSEVDPSLVAESPDAPDDNRVWRLAPGQVATVLVVDDIESNREVLVRPLAEAGFSVIEAGDGREALAQVRLHRPKLVFMDIRMPVMNGIDATQAILGDPDIADTVVIAITASVFPDARSTVTAAGCHGIASKPVRLPEIFHILGQYFELEAGDVPAASPPQAALDVQLARRLAPRLRAAIDVGDMERVEAISTEFASHPAWHEQLQRHVSGFDLDAIDELVRTMEQIVAEDQG